MDTPNHSHVVHTGPLHPVLEGLLLDRVAQLQASSRLEPVVVVTGSNLASVHLRRLLADESGGHINVRFLTPVSLAEALVARGSEGPQCLGGLPLGATYRLAVTQAESLSLTSVLHRVSRRPGFAPVLEKSLLELREICGGALLPETALPASLTDLVPLYNAFTRAIGDRTDIVSLFGAACGAVGGFEKATGAARVLVYGLYNPTPSQERLLHTLAGVITVEAFVPWTPGEAFTMSSAMLGWCVERGFTHIHHSLGSLADSVEARSDLDRVRLAPVFAGPKASGVSTHSHASDGSFAMLSCAGREREVMEIAREVLASARQGVLFRNIAVLLRSPGEYTQLIRDTFGRLNIPFYMPDARKLVETPYGRGTNLLLKLVTSDFTRRDVVEFLQEAPLAAGNELAGQWARLALLAGVSKGKEQWLSRLERLTNQFPGGPSSEDDDGCSDSADARELLTLLRSVFGCLASLPRLGSWPLITDSLKAALDTIFRPDEGLLEVSALLDGLRGLDALEPEVSLGDFSATLALQLEGAALDEGSHGDGGVNVLPLMAARGLGFEVVFIAGLTEKSFPAMRSVNPLLSDSVRDALEELIGCQRLAACPQYDEELLLFSLAIGSARERLVLSFATVERLTGRELTPSPFVLLVASALLGRSARYSDLAPSVMPCLRRYRLSQIAPQEGLLAVCDREFDLWAMGQEWTNPESYLAGVSVAARLPLDCQRSRWASPDLNRWCGSVACSSTSGSLRAATISAMSVSPTLVEQFCRCPFAGFLKYILRVEVVEEAEDPWMMDAKERGNVVHEILRDFVAATMGQRRAPANQTQSEQYVLLLEASASRVLDRITAGGRASLGVIWRHERREILRRLRVYAHGLAANLGAYKPILLEAPFGRGGVPTSLPLWHGGPVAHFHGRMDRVDADGEGNVRVIDYKTGRKKGKPGSLLGGQAIQLPIYALAASALRVSGQTTASRMSAEYHYVLNEASDMRACFDDEALKSSMPELSQILSWLDWTIQAGYFPQYPGRNKENCGFCPFRPICGTSVNTLSEVKAGDAAVQAYKAVRGEEL